MSEFIKVNIEGVEKEYKRDEVCLYDDEEGGYYIANAAGILSLMNIDVPNNHKNSAYSKIAKEEYERIQAILEEEKE